MKRMHVLAAAVASLMAAGAHATVITGWNTDNVLISTTAPDTAGSSVIYDQAPVSTGAVTNGKVVFDGTESDTPGLKVVNDAAPGVPASNGDVDNCVMANSPASCNSEKQSGKRFKFMRTGHGSTDMVFNTDAQATFQNVDNNGQYKFFMAYGNDTGARLGSFAISLGSGIGADFVDSTTGDGLSVVQLFGGKLPNNSQFSALFANGLFGAIDEVHPLTGYFSEERAGFNMAFTGEDSFVSTGLFGAYTTLFGPMLSYDELPMGFFYDDDGDASTDNVLIAHQLTDGSWVQNRDVLSDGSVITLAYGNDGIAFADYNALLAALTVNGLTVCDYASTPTACLAGADTIDDLAKFNLTFIIDPSGVTADSFTVRIDSAAAPVPEPGSFALAALALGAAGVSLRRRR